MQTMNFIIRSTLWFWLAMSFSLAFGSCAPVMAQFYADPESSFDEMHQYSSGETGDFGRVSLPTGEGAEGMGGEYAEPTMPQATAMVPTMSGQLAPRFGSRGRNGLPVTSLDSFVKNAGGYAEQIYGDEGSEGLPQIKKFKAENRINYGIVGDRARGLTTGHGSVLPCAWGADRKTGGTEWSMSGSPYPQQSTITIQDVRATVETYVNLNGPMMNWDLGGN